jgi:hypothetical protein
MILNFCILIPLEWFTILEIWELDSYISSLFFGIEFLTS